MEQHWPVDSKATIKVGSQKEAYPSGVDMKESGDGAEVQSLEKSGLPQSPTHHPQSVLGAKGQEPFFLYLVFPARYALGVCSGHVLGFLVQR